MSSLKQLKVLRGQFCGECKSSLVLKGGGPFCIECNMPVMSDDVAVKKIKK